MESRWSSGVRVWSNGVRKRELPCGRIATLPVIRELQPFIREFRLPYERFDELIAGVEMDLDTTRYTDQASLERYCYHVASVVGLLSIEIFGYRNPRCREYADALGKALQLTNILRMWGTMPPGSDLLPQADLVRHGVLEEDILQRRNSDAFRRLAAEMAQRAREFYRRARELLPAGYRAAMVAAEVMGAVYWKLLQRIERTNYDVLADEPLRLSKARKLGLFFLPGAGPRPVCPWPLTVDEPSRMNPSPAEFEATPPTPVTSSGSGARRRRPIRLIVNADDFGRSSGANRAIERAYRRVF